MGIKMIEQTNDKQIFDYNIPGFINENNNVGNKSDDFEILQVLGIGGFSCVLKVKSKINSGIYAMKRVDMLSILNQQLDKKYFENEVLILQRLNNPYIIKCYKIFQESNILYFIMEFMNNGDLESFYEAKKALRKSIPEEKLWDIFYKSLYGLDYIHKNGLIHRDIKLQNLFIDDNLNIKIGDFNISVLQNVFSAQKFLNQNVVSSLLNNNTDAGTDGYKAPEIKFGNYNEKVDVYSMGISFFELAYGCKPYEKFPKERFYQQNKYSKELNNLIDKMIVINPKNRISSNDAYLIAKKYFIKKFLKNTAIEVILNCFYNFPNFTEYFSNNEYMEFLTDEKREIGTNVFNIIQSLKDNRKDDTDNGLYELRKIMTRSGLKNIKDNEEIDPGKFISFFIKKLNSELNEINNIVIDPNDKKQYLYFVNTHLFNKGEEENVFHEFNKIYNKRLLSLISRNFFSILKTERQCKKCNYIGFNYTMIHFIPINLDILNKKLNNLNNNNIKDLFTCLSKDHININKDKSIVCQKCKKVQEHIESKKFYHTAKNLIIIFDRGENYENQTFINYDEELILTGQEVERYMQLKYELIGIIEKYEINNQKKYISLVKKDNKWISNEGKICNFENTKNIGTVIALFYYCTNDDLILQPYFSDILMDNNNNFYDQNGNYSQINNINPLFNINYFNNNYIQQNNQNIMNNNGMQMNNMMNNMMNNNGMQMNMMNNMMNNNGMQMNMMNNNRMQMNMNNNMMNNNGMQMNMMNNMMNNNGIQINTNNNMMNNNGMQMNMNNNMMNNNGMQMNMNNNMMNNNGIQMNMNNNIMNNNGIINSTGSINSNMMMNSDEFINNNELINSNISINSGVGNNMNNNNLNNNIMGVNTFMHFN